MFERWDSDLKYKVRSIRFHPDFNPCKSVTHEYDVAMLVTTDAIPVTESSNRVCLPSAEINIFGKAVALGFGFTSSGDKLPWRRLNSVNVLVNNDNTCVKHDPPFMADMICVVAGDLNFCSGDSGGPLVVENQGAWTLLGLNSITDSTTTDAVECTGVSRKSKFVKIGNMMKWLGETMEQT